MKAPFGSTYPFICTLIHLDFHPDTPIHCLLSQAVVQGGAVLTEKIKGRSTIIVYPEDIGS